MYLSALTSDESYTSNKKVWLAENEAVAAPDLSSVNENGTPTTTPLNKFYLEAENEEYLYIHADAKRPRVVMYGAFRYNSMEKLVTYNTTYTNLVDTGLWAVEGNALVWVGR